MEDGGGKVRDVDGGWAWVALVATVLILCLQSSFSITVGLFLKSYPSFLQPGKPGSTKSLLSFLQPGKSVLAVEFADSFSGSKGYIALIGALSVSGQTLLGPVAGILSNLLTHRLTIIMGAALLTLGLFTASFSQDLNMLLLLFGVVCGIGMGLIYSPAVTVISTYFCKYRIVANGVTLGAPGMGVLLVPYLLQWLIESYGWRYAMVAYGCFMAQTCVLAALLYPHNASTFPSCCACPSKKKAPPTDSAQDGPSLQAPVNGSLHRMKDLRNAEITVMVGSRTAMHVSEFGSVLLSNSVVWTVEEVKSGTLRRLKHLLRRRFMWVMCFNQLLLMAGLAINFVLFPSYAHSIGISGDDLPAIYTVFGVTMMVARVAGGFIFSLIPQHMLKVFFCLQVCVALVLTLLPLFGVTLEALFVYKFLVGLTYGPTFLLVTPILIHYIGLEDLSVGFGIVMLCCGFGYVTAPPLGGLMYDFFGTYKVSYYIAGTTVGAGALSLLLLLLIKDLQPMGEADAKQEPLVTANQQESEENDDGSSATKANGAAVQQKPSANGVHVIDDMDELRNFIDNRHS